MRMPLMPTAQVNSSRELQPYGVRRKENLDRATAWNQAPLLPGTTAATPGPPAGGAGGLDIFTDEEFRDGDNDARGRAPGAGRCRGGGASGPTAQSLLLPGSERAAGATSGGVDALMASLAPPRTLLRGLPQGPVLSVSIAALSISTTAAAAAPAAVFAQQQQPQPMASKVGPAAGPLVLQSDGALSARSAFASRGAQPSGGPAEGPSPAAAAEDGAGEPGPNGGDEELSFEELRAAVWFRRKSVTRPSVSCAAPMGWHGGAW